MRAKIKKIKAEKRDDIAFQVRAKYVNRWMQRTAEITGTPCESAEDIDYSD